MTDPRDILYVYRCGAGSRAQARFNVLSRRWRQRVLRVPRLLAVTVVIPLLVGARLDHHYLSWGLGLAVGAVMALYMALRDTPPPHIEHWRGGAQGERRTAHSLAPLRRRGWVLFHDLPDRSPDGEEYAGNVDHVLVGPSGVYVLDSKWLGGDVTVEDDIVRVQRRDDETEAYQLDRLAAAMRRRALSLHRDISREVGRTRFVQAVVVFCGGFDAGIVEGNRVVFLDGARLLEWLAARPKLMDAQMVALVAAAIEQARPRDRVPWWTQFGFRWRRAREPVTEAASGTAK